MQDYRYVYRFRTNLSFPALSNCSADGDPGNGNAADGDSIGTINGFVEWDNAIVDGPGHWQVRLTLRDLTTLWGAVVRAPDSATVDVTPRRLQAFVLSPQYRYSWKVLRSSDGATIQSGSSFTDALGVLTIPGVNVMRTGSVLEVDASQFVGVDPSSPTAAGTRPSMGPLASPVRSACTLTVEWPRAGEAIVDVLDLEGRRIRRLFRGSVGRGVQELRLDPGGLPSGIYFLAAREGTAAAGRRFAVLH